MGAWLDRCIDWLLRCSFLARHVDRRLHGELALRRKILDSIPGTFYVFDMSGRFLVWNHNLEAVVGMTHEEVARAHPRDFFDEQDRPRVESAIHEVFATGQSAVEAVLCAKDGTRTPFYFNGFRMDLDGEPVLLGMGIDITERKRVEAEMFDAKDRLSLALEASSLSIWDCDINEGNVYFDGRWAEITGNLPGIAMVPTARLFDQVHPDDHDRLLRAAIDLLKGRTPSLQEEFRFKTASGWKWIRCSGKIAERDASGWALRAIGTNLDITERKAAEERIHQLAYYDSLTGLPNRRLLIDRLRQALSQARRFDRSLAIMFLDLDDFKRINDTLGHDVGDELLKQAAQRLLGCVRTGDTVSRQGGDEFVIVLSEIAQPADAARVAEKVVRAMETPFRLAGKDLSVTASVGIHVRAADGTDDVNELMKKADIAMYAAKRAGGNRYAFYSDDMATGS